MSTETLDQYNAPRLAERPICLISEKSLLKYYREAIMQAVIAKYDQVPEDERKAIGSLANFSCSLHALIHIEEAVEKAISDTEKANQARNKDMDACQSGYTQSRHLLWAE